MTRPDIAIGSFPSLAEAILDALPHPVIMVSADGHVASANAAAESFFEASLFAGYCKPPLRCAT